MIKGGKGSGLSVGGKTSARLGCIIESRLLIYKRELCTDQAVYAVQAVQAAQTANSKQQSLISINDRDKITLSTDHLIVIFVNDKIRCGT